MSDPEKSDRPVFDYDAHRKTAVENFGRKRDLYEHFAATVRDILKDAITARELRINEIQFRAKGLESFGKKCTTPAEQDPEEPKYKNPIQDITDLAGVRVITFFPSTVEQVCGCIQDEFDVIERVDHTATAQNEERLGYLSVHYLISLGDNRKRLPEYKRFGGLVAEIQVRTVMQHAWAEIEHDIRYKSASAIPQEISRRFMTLAGLLEIADREFEAIQQQDAFLRENARTLITAGKLKNVEITPDAIRQYLNFNLGFDDRISDHSYEITAKLLRHLGFQNLQQVDDCVSGLNDDMLSRFAFGSRSGQVSRFEIMLLASMGEDFINSHPWNDSVGYKTVMGIWLDNLKRNGVAIGSYQPKPYGSSNDDSK